MTSEEVSPPLTTIHHQQLLTTDHLPSASTLVTCWSVKPRWKRCLLAGLSSDDDDRCFFFSEALDISSTSLEGSAAFVSSIAMTSVMLVSARSSVSSLAHALSPGCSTSGESDNTVKRHVVMDSNYGGEFFKGTVEKTRNRGCVQSLYPC